MDDETSCGKGGVGGTEFCSNHGGGRRCIFGLDDGTSCGNGAEGGSEFCKSHGGGRRCQMQCCFILDNPTLAIAKHPGPGEDEGKYMCTFAARCLVSSSTPERAKELNEYFGFKKDLVLRGENCFFHELNKLVPDLLKLEYVFDCSVKGPKSINTPRPDAFFYLNDIGLHIEYDETLDHENCDIRLKSIGDQSECKGVYVIRVNGRHGLADAIGKKKTTKKNTYYKTTEIGLPVIKSVAVLVRERLGWMKLGLCPCDERAWKTNSGNKKTDVGASKVYSCQCCGLVADRDFNSAKNHLIKIAYGSKSA
jgi:hypothetical protein